jgi:putative methionine-R-sulfoxide reductase with GAF domain
MDPIRERDLALVAKLRELIATDAPRPVRAREAAAAIRETTGARWIGIYTVADAIVRNEAWDGPGPPAHPSFTANQGLTAHALAARAAALSNDVAGDPRYLANQDDSGSELIIPILVDGSARGTLDIESDRVSAFHGPDVARYELLADALVGLWASSPRRSSA